MQNRLRPSMMAIVAVAAAVGVVISAPIAWAQAQKPAASAPGAALKTPWGDPDLQGIWTEETDTPLQRPARFANQEYFTPEQRAELDEVRSPAKTSVRSAGPNSTLAAPTISCSCPASTPARAPR